MSSTSSRGAAPHTVKAKSISSLPLPRPHSLRLTPSTSSSSVISRPTASSSNRSSPSAMAVRSPSRIPPANSMSYFPPFELMGSNPNEPEAGPSKPRSPRKRDDSLHARGRSLGSLAGIMSFLTPVASPTCRPMSTSPVQTADDEALQALTKKVTPGKRRVLEPMSVRSEVGQGLEEVHKRRMGSEAEGLSRKDERKRTEVDEETVIEGLISETPHGRRPRPLLTVPLPSFPNWRFPLPSPPLTSLSPDIPIEAFHPIDNPASAPTSREPSPGPGAPPPPDGEVDEVENDLSPTTSTGSVSGGLSQPSTPPKQDRDGPEVYTSLEHMGRGECRRRLERTDSQFSTDSKETIKACILEEGDEVAPKAEKAWGKARHVVDVVV